MRPEQELRSYFWFFVFVVSIGMMVLLFVSWQFPFDVDLNAEVEQSNGEWFFINSSGSERRFTDSFDMLIQAEEGIRLGVNTNARVEVIKDSGAFVYLSEGAEWKVLSGERRGTALEHITNDARDYEMLIEQTTGIAVYDFSQANPPLTEMDITLRFRDGEFIPEIPCFQATAPTEELPSEVVEVPCRSEIQ